MMKKERRLMSSRRTHQPPSPKGCFTHSFILFLHSDRIILSPRCDLPPISWSPGLPVLGKKPPSCSFALADLPPLRPDQCGAGVLWSRHGAWVAWTWVREPPGVGVHCCISAFCRTWPRVSDERAEGLGTQACTELRRSPAQAPFSQKMSPCRALRS